jgi:hypothetical protein
MQPVGIGEAFLDDKADYHIRKFEELLNFL